MVSDSKRWDVVVIGCGPAGSSAANELSSKGHDVLVLESRKEIGIPVQCGEAISLNTLELSGLDVDGPWVVGRFEGYRIVCPSGKNLFSNTDGVNIDRELFDKELADIAITNGAEIRTDSPVSKAIETDGEWSVVCKGDNIRSRGLIVSCGSYPEVLLGSYIKKEHEIMRGLGFKVKYSGDEKEIRFHVKGVLKGGYGWFFPRGDHANAGIVSYTNPKDDMKWLMEREGVVEEDIISYSGGVVPISGPVNPLIGDNGILVGDSMGASNPVSKGGVVGAIITGKEGGDALGNKLKGDGEALRKWASSLFEHPALSLLNLERNRMLSALDDEVLDALGDIIDGKDIWTVKKTDVIREIFKRPHVLNSLRGALKLARGGRDWARWAY